MSAHRRLMDLLAGWADYAYRCEESDNINDTTPRSHYKGEAERILDAYQDVGQWHDDPKADARAVDWATWELPRLIRDGAAAPLQGDQHE